MQINSIMFFDTRQVYLDQWKKILIGGTITAEENVQDALDKLKKEGDEFYDRNYPQSIQVSRTHTVIPYDTKDDDEWTKLQSHLSTFEFYEDAETFLNTTEFKMAVEAKKLINQKPHKQKIL